MGVFAEAGSFGLALWGVLREIVRLRGSGAISDDVMHRIERDLDLEDVRLG